MMDKQTLQWHDYTKGVFQCHGYLTHHTGSCTRRCLVCDRWPAELLLAAAG